MNDDSKSIIYCIIFLFDLSRLFKDSRERVNLTLNNNEVKSSLLSRNLVGL